MSGSETEIQWFIARDGKQHGPVSDVELRKLVELTHLKATDLVWRQGFSDWRTAGSVFPAISEPAPAPTLARAPTGPVTAPQTAPQAAPQSSSPNTAAKVLTAAPVSVSQSQPTTQRPTLAPTAHDPYAPATAAPEPRTARPETRQDMRPDTRPAPAPTRPLGSAPRSGAYPAPSGYPGPGPGGAPGPGPRTTTDSRKPSEMTAPPRPQAPAKSRRGLVATLGVLVMIGVGAWLGSRYKSEILAYVQSGKSDDIPTVAANVIPTEKVGSPSAAAVQPAAAHPAPSLDDVDRSLQGRTMWVSVKQEFPDWYQARVSEVARMGGEQKDQVEITRYLVGQLVSLRRENAKLALSASTARHKEVAAAFLANLKTLSLEGGEGCYDFISKGESSAAIVTRLQDPSKSAEIEAQVVAIISAITEGRKQPSPHSAPVKTDYDVLAGELGRLGWTQADMQLFANPKELAKAPRERVCSMLKDWFTAHLAIQDPNAQERLLFETLKPVLSG